MTKTKLSQYRKFLVASAGLALTVAATAFPDSKYTIAAIAVATAAGVWRVPNKTQDPKSVSGDFSGPTTGPTSGPFGIPQTQATNVTETDTGNV